MSAPDIKSCEPGRRLNPGKDPLDDLVPAVLIFLLAAVARLVEMALESGEGHSADMRLSNHRSYRD